MNLFRLEVVSETEEAVTLAFFGYLTHRNLEQLDSMLTMRSGANPKILLDLRGLSLLDRDAAAFLRQWEKRGAKLVNGCPYVLRWVRDSTQ